MEPSWNPGGTLLQGCPGPPRSLSGLRPQSCQLLRKKGILLARRLHVGEKAQVTGACRHLNQDKTGKLVPREVPHPTHSEVGSGVLRETECHPRWHPRPRRPTHSVRCQAKWPGPGHHTALATTKHLPAQNSTRCNQNFTHRKPELVIWFGSVCARKNVLVECLRICLFSLRMTCSCFMWA